MVTAARMEQDEEDVAASVTIYDQDDIDHSAALTVDDFLRRSPGFSLFRRASSVVAHPTTQGVSLRGIGPSGVSRSLVLLDGVPMNDPFGGWIYWSRVPLMSLEKVEIVRGGSSSIWGNSALAGVVQLFTAPPADGVLDIATQVGTKATGRLDVMWSDHWSNGSYRLWGEYFDTDGYYVVSEDTRGAIDIPAFSEVASLGGEVDFDLSDSIQLAVLATTFDEERGNGTPLTNNATDSTNLTLRVNALGDGGGEWLGSATAFDQGFESTFSSQADDRSTEGPALDQYSVPSDSLGLAVHWNRAFGDQDQHRLGAGIDGRVSDGETNERFLYTDDVPALVRTAGGDESNAGLYVQDTIAVGDRVQVQVGARVDRWKTSDGFRVERFIATGIARRDETFEDRSETEVSPRVAAVFSANDSTQVRGSIYRSFRAPSINELFRPFRVGNVITEANGDLVPETLDGIDLGVDFRTGTVRASATVFYNEVNDAIANVSIAPGPGVIAPCGFVPGDGICRQRQNLDRTRIQGIEAEIRQIISSHWEWGASYQFSDGTVKEAAQAPELIGRQLPQVPENQVVLSGLYRNPSAVDVSGLVRIVDEQFEDDLNLIPLASFVVFDLDVSRQLNERWNVFVGVENVFDEVIETGRAPGRVNVGTPRLFHGGFRLRWGQ